MMAFDNLDTWWLIVRGVMLLAAFLAFAWALLVSRRDASLAFARLAAQHEQAITEIRVLSEKVADLAEQVRELSLPSPMTSRRLPVAAPPPPPAQPPSASSNGRGYEMATRMARAGASIDEIVASCGTTRSEARLLQRLHCAGGASAA